MHQSVAWAGNQSLSPYSPTGLMWPNSAFWVACFTNSLLTNMFSFLEIVSLRHSKRKGQTSHWTKNDPARKFIFLLGWETTRDLPTSLPPCAMHCQEVAHQWGGGWLWSLRGWWLVWGVASVGGIKQRSHQAWNHWSSNNTLHLSQRQRSKNVLSHCAIYTCLSLSVVCRYVWSFQG